MNAPAARFLSPSEAARQLGISAKALRLYEERGLIAPGRTPAGWRAYGPAEMARCAEIVELRALGLSINEVARILSGDAIILGVAESIVLTSFGASWAPAISFAMLLGVLAVRPQGLFGRRS